MDGRLEQRRLRLRVGRARGGTRDGVDWQTGDEELDAAERSTHVGGASEQRRPRTVGFLRDTDRRTRGRRRRLDGRLSVGDIVARHVADQSVGDRSCQLSTADYR